MEEDNKNNINIEKNENKKLPSTEKITTMFPVRNKNFTINTKTTTTTATIKNNESEKNSFKKLNRAFRWSKRFHNNKTNNNTKNGYIDDVGTVPPVTTTNDHYNENGNENSINNATNTIEMNNVSLSSSSSAEAATANNNKILRKSSFRKFLSRIAQHVTSVSIIPNKYSLSSSSSSSTTTGTTTISDRVPPIGGYQWPPDQIPGVTGLKNHGNTCFMNAVLQCLSHTDILAEYFVLDQYKADLKRRNKINSRKFGTKGELTEQLANVLKALWTCKNENDHSTSFKAVVDRYGSQFKNSTQHDAQEFLFWLLDKVHEDLNTASKKRYKAIKNNYGRPDEVIAAETLANHIRCNNSFVQAVFQAQFRSSLTCPRCHKQSNTFDPFHCISVQLPQLSQKIIYVTVLYAKKHPKQIKFALTIPNGSPVIILREQLSSVTGIQSDRTVLVDINSNGFSRIFYNSQPISTLDGTTSIYCIEIPEIKNISSSTSELMLLITNVQKFDDGTVCRFGTPFCVQVSRDCSYVELQKKLLKEMSGILKSDVFTFTTPLTDMFRIRLQDPSADPDTYLEQVEHPLFTEIIDMALSLISSDAGPSHIKLLLEWKQPEIFFSDINDVIVEHESVTLLKNPSTKDTPLTLEQCLEHYTKAETLSAEDAWRCPNCQQYLPVVKTLGLWSLPDIMVIHFKRFRQQNEKGPDAAKLTTMVKFPLNSFDMSPHLARGSTNSNDSLSCNNENNGGAGGNNSLSNNKNNYRFSNNNSPWQKTKDFNKLKDKEKELKDNRYDLYAVCYHQGDTLETGHYTAACKNPYDRQWYKFDDQRVTHVPSDKVQEQIVNNEAYILFYQRRKIDNIEYSGTSSNSGDHWVSKIAIQSSSISLSNTTTASINNNISSKLNMKNGYDNNNVMKTTIKPPPSSEEEKENEEEAAAASSLPTDTTKLANSTENHNSNDKLTTQNNECSKNSNDLNKKTIKLDIKLVDSMNENNCSNIIKSLTAEAIFIKKTDENEIIDIESLDDNKEMNIINNECAIEMNDNDNLTKCEIIQENHRIEIDDKIDVLKQATKDESLRNSNDHNKNITNDSLNEILDIDNDDNNGDHNNIISSCNNTSESSNNKKLIEKYFIKSLTKPTTTIKQRHSDENYYYYLKNDSFNNINNDNNDVIDDNNDDNDDDDDDNNKANDKQIKENESITTYGGFYCISNSSTALSNRSSSSSIKLRHSFSTSSTNCNYNNKLRDSSSTSAPTQCDTLSSMLRNSASSCSKGTLLYIDQQNHHSLIDEDDSFLGNRSIWISPVTPHKLITVSPKN